MKGLLVQEERKRRRKKFVPDPWFQEKGRGITRGGKRASKIRGERNLSFRGGERESKQPTDGGLSS